MNKFKQLKTNWTIVRERRLVIERRKSYFSKNQKLHLQLEFKKLINPDHHVARFDDGVNFFSFRQLQAFRRIFRDNRDDFHAVWKFDDDLRVDRARLDWFDCSF